MALACAGFSAGLLLQERLLALTPADTRGQALGLHTSGMLAMQGVAALLAGAVAEQMDVGDAMATMAAASLAVTLILIPKFRQGQRPAAAVRGTEPHLRAEDAPPTVNPAAEGLESRDAEPPRKAS